MNTTENEESREPVSSASTPAALKPKKSKKGIIIILAIVAVIVGAVAFFVYKAKQNALQNKLQNELLTAEQRAQAVQSLFSVKAYDKIPDTYKEHIYYFLEYNKWLDGTYFLTKIEDRAKDVFAFGDFTNDDNDEDDLAVIFENNDFKSCKLVIFNHKGELLFSEDYTYLPTIKSFKVGAKIFMEETKLVPAPVGGLLLQSEYSKEALLYDKKNKKFNTYHQYTDEEIKAVENEGDYEAFIDDTPEEAPEAAPVPVASKKEGVMGIFEE